MKSWEFNFYKSPPYKVGRTFSSVNLARKTTITFEIVIVLISNVSTYTSTGIK